MPEKPEFAGSLENKLPPEFKKFLEKEKQINSAQVMADAMLEENHTLSAEEAFKIAMKILNNPVMDLSDLCHNKGNE